MRNETGVTIQLLQPQGGELHVVGKGTGELSPKMQQALEAIDTISSQKVVKKDPSPSEILIKEFVRQHGSALTAQSSERFEDEFGQSDDQAVPFAEVVFAARADGLKVRDVRNLVKKEIGLSNIEPQNRDRVGDIITREMVEMARRDYPIPEHDFYKEE